MKPPPPQTPTRSLIKPYPKRTLPALVAALWGALLLPGCTHPDPPYGSEAKFSLPTGRTQVWAVAPALNISGQKQVDSILQADLLFSQLQQVGSLTVVPVNRVVEVYTALKIDRIESEAQAKQVCDLLGCDALVVPTVTFFDPYNPPKFGGALQLFLRHGISTTNPVDPQKLSQQASPSPAESQNLPRHSSFIQVADIFDAQNGSVRDKVAAYAAGRFDPKGPLKAKEYYVSMDRYVGFAYHELIVGLLSRPQLNPM